MRKHLIPLLLGVLALSSCPQDTGVPSSAAGLVRAGIPADLLGMVHAGSRSEVTEEYALLDELGVEWMLTDFSWSEIQPVKNAWNLDAFKTYADNGRAKGKKILAILDYDVDWLHDNTHADDPHYAGDGCTGSHRYISPSEISLFCEYVKKTVDHYKDRVDAWCIWNEPNLNPRFWQGTMEEFFALTKAAAAAIREVQPDAFIIGGAFNSLVSDAWVRGIFESGAMAQINAIAYHPYMPRPGPMVNLYSSFKEKVSPYGFRNKIWVTEMGYPVHGNMGTEVEADRMPETVMLTITLLTVNGAERIFWYELFDHGDSADQGDAENWFGMVNGGGLINGEFQKRPWAHAYKLCALNIPGANAKTPLRQGLPDSLRAYHFEGPGGNHALIIWNEVTVKARDVKVYLPGKNQRRYNLDTGEPEPIGQSSTYTLKSKDGTNHSIQFFTWENTNYSQVPRISAP
ncbi:MAG: hypothetical protein LBQ46_03285 [Treponema sp.]|jgi:hypothetical protein|nr:hypothetical protein [Treponema sp.]